MRKLGKTLGLIGIINFFKKLLDKWQVRGKED